MNSVACPSPTLNADHWSETSIALREEIPSSPSVPCGCTCSGGGQTCCWWVRVRVVPHSSVCPLHDNQPELYRNYNYLQHFLCINRGRRHLITRGVPRHCTCFSEASRHANPSFGTSPFQHPSFRSPVAVNGSCSDSVPWSLSAHHHVHTRTAPFPRPTWVMLGADTLFKLVPTEPIARP